MKELVLLRFLSLLLDTEKENSRLVYHPHSVNVDVIVVQRYNQLEKGNLEWIHLEEGQVLNKENMFGSLS